MSRGRHGHCQHRCGAIMAIALGLATPALGAGFELPILYDVPKTVAVSENIDPEVLRRLAGVDNLTLEIRLEGGNMMRDGLIRLLNESFSKARKRLLLEGPLSQIHVDQLRRIGQFEIAYHLADSDLDRSTFNLLFALGPVRKHMIIDADAPAVLLTHLARLKYVVPLIRVGPGGLSPAVTAWLIGRPGRGVCFALPAAVEPELIHDLVQFSPVTLVVGTTRNRIPDRTLKMLKDLRGVDLLVQVDESLTLADVKALAVLERFSLHVNVIQNSALSPGLVQLLNQVRPPLRR